MRRHPDLMLERRSARRRRAAVALALVAAGVGVVGTSSGADRQASTPVTLEWVGDTVLGSAYGLPPNGGRDSLSAVSKTLRRSDLTWGNLEETLSVGGVSKCGAAPSSNCFAFQAPPSYARLLGAAGFDLMNLANNHAYDFGSWGLTQTHRALARAGLRWAGGPSQFTILTAKGVRVAFLGFAPYPWASRLDRIAAAKRLVRRAATKADLVVIAIHAGAEGSGATHVPRGTEYFLGENRGNSRAFTHAVVDAGADLVVGSGPHVIRGVEWYHGRLIAYSTGNFAGYHNFGLGGVLSLSAILRVTLASDGSFVKGRWIPVRLVGAGLPRLDPSKASLRLVGALSREDFGARGARFTSAGSIRGG